MSNQFVPMTPALADYLTSHSTRRDPLLAELCAETARLGEIQVMQIAASRASFRMWSKNFVISDRQM